ncbi:MAG TPA: hypothetical protein VGR40_03855 [Candidatus Binatus sp.]|nr:hypothetical protein [Candidatus Binatus sp.]
MSSHQPVKDARDGAESLNATMESICQETRNGGENIEGFTHDCESASSIFHVMPHRAIARASRDCRAPIDQLYAVSTLQDYSNFGRRLSLLP